MRLRQGRNYYIPAYETTTADTYMSTPHQPTAETGAGLGSEINQL